MVWELAPLDPTGLSKHYLIRQGTYRVGRKDCDVIIQTDKTISRLHSEIIIDAATSLNPIPNSSSFSHPQIRLKDLSKFGTFVNKESSSKAVFSLENREIVLKDGDLITFGTNATTYRLSFLLFFFCIPYLDNMKDKNELCEAVTSMGSYLIKKWRSDCTHIIVEDSSAISDDVIEAIISRRPIVSFDWFRTISREKYLLHEIPACSSFAPTLMLNIMQASVTTKAATPKQRESCFAGVTFVISEHEKYYYKTKLRSLLEVAGASVVTLTSKISNMQSSEMQGNQELLVIPYEGKNKNFGRNAKEVSYIKKTPSVTETEAVEAAISGVFNRSSFQCLSCPSPSSSSTRETTDIADSEDENEVTLVRQSSLARDELKVGKHNNSSMKPSSHELQPQVNAKTKTDVTCAKLSSTTSTAGFLSLSKRAILESSPTVEKSIKSSAYKSQSAVKLKSQTQSQRTLNFTGLCSEPGNTEVKAEADIVVDAIEHPKFDVLFSPALIIKKDSNNGNIDNISNVCTQNFKRFRQKPTISGNSFADLIPFAKHAYKESDYGREMAEYMKEEKKRKEAEALAEDLFNAERLKRKRGGRL